MKRIRLLVLAGAIAVALPFGMSTVGRHRWHGLRLNSVYIQDNADYDFAGTNVDVGLQVRCTDSTGFGTVDVQVDQAPPADPVPRGLRVRPPERGV